MGHPITAIIISGENTLMIDVFTGITVNMVNHSYTFRINMYNPELILSCIMDVRIIFHVFCSQLFCNAGIQQVEYNF